MPGSTQDPVNIEAQTQVQADFAGKYKLILDKSGIPAGEYGIQGAGDANIILSGWRIFGGFVFYQYQRME
ncbi:MAG: hypothetical protein WAW52_04775 [Methanothrix sp.]